MTWALPPPSSPVEAREASLVFERALGYTMGMGGTLRNGRAEEPAGPWISIDAAAAQYAVEPAAVRAWVAAGRVQALHPRGAAAAADGTLAGTDLVRADGLAALPAEVLLAAATERELARLRAELAAERSRARTQAIDLEAAQAALRAALEQPGAAPEAPPAAPSRRTASPVPALGWLAAGALGFALRPLVLPSPSLTPVFASESAALPQQPEREPLAPAPEPAGPANTGPANTVPASSGPASAGPASSGPASAGPAAALPAPATREPEALSSAAKEPGTVESAAPPRPDLPRTLAALAPLAWATVSGPACQFRGAAETLGPCFGAHSSDGPWVAGNHRVDGVDCCAHHQLVMRLGGDRAQLEAAAAFARSEGVLPPLVAARIDRAARAFLRAALGPWTSAGIDAFDGEGHQLRFTADGRARVETWIVPLDGQRVEVTLEIELSEGPDGDTLHVFEAVRTP